MNKTYKRIGYIARGQPPHRGHTETIVKALDLADEVVILIGSAYHSRDIRHPFTYSERAEMWRWCFNEEQNPKIRIQALPDYTYNMEQWTAKVQKIMTAPSTRFEDGVQDSDIALIGMKKDHTSFYLDHFPQWGEVKMDDISGLNATQIREMYFGLTENFARLLTSDDNKDLPEGVRLWLKQFMETKEYQWMRESWKWNDDYHARWSGTPYEVIFKTADNVVICAGHILLVKRRAFPGKGLWALPGGYLDPKETIAQSAYRELKEETKIDVPPGLLKSYYFNDNQVVCKEFDDVERSARGRVITTAYLVHLPPQKSTNTGRSKGIINVLPKVKGSDDAEKAKWFSLNEFEKMEPQMFEDHWQIAKHFIGKL